MNSFVLLLLLGISTVSSSPNREFLQQKSELGRSNDGYTLLFASAIWRHGDRSPERSLIGGIDKLKESDWKFGGGGYGQLSPWGHRQHFNLGRKLRARYVDTNFISKRYRAKEIYIRSTDYNRTLISAYSNLVGMYSSTNESVVGMDLPNVDSWPSGWVPIPVHTVFNPTDYEGNPDANCPRYDQLQDMVWKSAEAVNFLALPQIKQTREYLRNQTGVEVPFNKMYDFNNTMLIEKLHFNDTKPYGDNAGDVSEWYPWYWQGDIPYLVRKITDMSSKFLDGQGNAAGINGVDVSVEIPKVRAGDNIQSIRLHAEGVISCYFHKNDSNRNCEPFYKGLKYYVSSAHDSTLSAYLALIGVREDVLDYGNPQYSSATLAEFFVKDGTQDVFVKILYHANEGEDFRVITRLVSGCPIDNDYCPFKTFTDLADKFNPGDITALCNTQVVPNPSSHPSQ